MALIINIDTATDNASVALCKNGSLVAIKSNEQQKEHAAFVHKAIESLLQQSKITMNEVNAFAVTSGPGSYTGLRVSMAAAKGLCYALNKPLICLNTLLVMACAAKNMIIKKGLPVFEGQLLCPMIDARRMEVFMAMYNMDLEEVLPTMPKILAIEFLQDVENKNIYFFGNGSLKIFYLPQNNVEIINVITSAEYLGILADEYFNKNQFSNVTYSHPQYFKEFYFGDKRVDIQKS
ncbi:MAG: tRNA (adenosine(37)-N6)-threonylcarbamoyltransferase complex dimerization subunit type 1 TsaB [Chitinophagaceae bacterium]|nr:tRNA (adenosine(37)-N6)-threonylcarbamoyltransferase complex dimerization subunit type 1 TsaB [Chitinophagaceae bacterium]